MCNCDVIKRVLAPGATGHFHAIPSHLPGSLCFPHSPGEGRNLCASQSRASIKPVRLWAVLLPLEQNRKTSLALSELLQIELKIAKLFQGQRGKWSRDTASIKGETVTASQGFGEVSWGRPTTWSKRSPKGALNLDVVLR
jgi:hypothetical protein